MLGRCWMGYEMGRAMHRKPMGQRPAPWGLAFAEPREALSRRGLWFGVLACWLSACSALVNPDPARLGGSDDGGVARSDAAPDDGDGPECSEGCDDGIACTQDRCQHGICEHAPDPTRCGADERCNPVLDCVPRRCTRHQECDDGIFCNGVETCDPEAGDQETGCAPGEPVVCTDGVPCTLDRCDEALDRCVFEPNHDACADSVDCTVDRCEPGADSDPQGCVRTPDDSWCELDFCTVGSTCDPSSGCVGGSKRDCDDASPCTVDICNDTEGRCDHELRDDDNDGFGPISVFESRVETTCGGTDCDDHDDERNPDADELCNGRDDNCNGIVDEGCPIDPPDDCRSAQEIVIPSAGSVSVSGSFADLNHDYDASAICGPGSNGRDAVYFFDLPPGRWDVTIDTIGSAADTVLGVGLACNQNALRLACNDNHDSSTRASRIWLHNVGGLSATRVWVLVDGYSNAEVGTYTLQIDRRAAAPDTCGSMTSTQPLDITGGGTVLGVQSRFTHSERGSCQNGANLDPEAVLQLQGPTSESVRFDVYSTDFYPDIYLRASPCESGTEVGCDLGSYIAGNTAGSGLRLPVTSGSTYYLFVDGGRGSYVVYYQPF